MLGLVPLMNIRLMPQTINMTKVHGFSYMDATSYNEAASGNFCCIQMRCPVNDNERVPFVGLYSVHMENVQVRMRS